MKFKKIFEMSSDELSNLPFRKELWFNWWNETSYIDKITPLLISLLKEVCDVEIFGDYEIKLVENDAGENFYYYVYHFYNKNDKNPRIIFTLGEHRQSEFQFRLIWSLHDKTVYLNDLIELKMLMELIARNSIDSLKKFNEFLPGSIESDYINELKENWLDDPCYDIEETSEYQMFYYDLLLYRYTAEREWNLKIKTDKKKAIQKLKANYGDDIWDYAYTLETKLSDYEALKKQLKVLLAQCNRAGVITDDDIYL